MSGLVLGLDGGGTQTRAIVFDLETGVYAERQAGACNVAVMPVSEAVQSVSSAARAALDALGAATSDVQAVCAGVAGASYTARRAEFRRSLQSLFPLARVAVVPDYAIALTGATEGAPGVLVIAGTGSVAYGENAQGQGHKAGGYGYLIDDAGSGYGVGRAALAAVLRAGDGTGEATVLVERVILALGLASAAEIVAGVYGGGIGRVQIASLSRVVSDAASQDRDVVARAILMRSGGALAQLVQAVTSPLFTDTSDEFPVVTVGGLWQSGEPLTDVFTRSVRRFAPGATIGSPRQPPVWGAVQQARRQLTTRP